MVLLQDGSILVVAPRPSGDSINPFVRLSAITGDTLPAPAARLKPPRRAGPDFAERAIALARDGQHFWSAHALRYAIEKRALDGTLVRTLERDIGWFRPSIAVAGVSADTAPTARVVAIWEDTRGMLWVHTITADGRWPSALGELPGVDGKPRYYVASRDLYFDTRIEIIDPENGRLIATAKYDSELPTFTPGPYLSRVLKGPSGWLVGEVWSVRLVGNR
jgi:hypothetical protein